MILFDVETTGLVRVDSTPLRDQPRIIEFAAIKLDDAPPYDEVGVEFRDEVIDSRMEFKCNPGIPLPEKITEITGLTDEDFKGRPNFAYFYPALCKFFLGEINLVAHNVEFDCSLLKFELMRIGKAPYFPWPFHRVDTVAASKPIMGHRLSLEKLITHITGEPHSGVHRAMADVEDLVMATRWLLEREMIILG